ncbi:acyl carrier protein [Streptococcus pantholopis]|uniref:Carrier domain-containing protein n=1 Tax=Streptococcus pantholopis TaxID=1811193 RepID=A0A172Q8B1_9STRE|nr:acyl carrier protein [Streptococcus pantholopis]AND79690.1 hypothetical protein A0O21_06455 [Streptococcus pantholopis]
MTELEKNVLELVAQAFNKDIADIGLDTTFKDDLAASSLVMVSLIANIEEELDVMIPISEAAKFKTVADLTAAVAAEA